MVLGRVPLGYQVVPGRVPNGSWEGAWWFLGQCHRGARRSLGGYQVVPGRVPVGSWEDAIRVPGGSGGCHWCQQGAIEKPVGFWEGASGVPMDD